MKRTGNIGRILMLVALTGLPAVAQVAPDQPERIGGLTQTGDQNEAWRLRRANSLLGATIVNDAGENIGSIQNLTIDRGTGRWTHAVVKSGSVLGIGGKTIAVPSTSLAPAADGHALTLGLTQEEIDIAPEFNADEWAQLDHTSWLEQFEEWKAEVTDEDAPDAEPPADPYQKDVDWTQAPETMTGMVREIDRAAVGHADPETVVSIETAEGRIRRVALCPSWYMAGLEAPLFRGDTVSLEGHPLPDGSGADFVAARVHNRGHTVELRDAQGSPRWAASGVARPPRLMLVSALIGAEAQLPSEDKTGEVQDVVVDLEGRRVMMIALDPNENILGVGDELKCVPWELVSIAPDNIVSLDLTKDALAACEPLPDDVTLLTSRAQIEPIYAPLGLEVPPQDRWAGGAEVAVAVDPAVPALVAGEEVEISGEVASVSEQRIEGFEDPMMVATIETKGGQESVVLGPASHFDEHPIELEPGEEVSIEAKRADVNGTEVTAACTIRCEEREIRLWRNGHPLWARA